MIEPKVGDTFGTTTITTYSQIYPFTGSPVAVQRLKQTPTGVILLSATSTDYCDTIVEVGGTPQCGSVSSPPKSIFTYPIKVTDAAILHNGTTMAGNITTVSEFRYDKWGNPRRNIVTTTKTEQARPTETYVKDVVNTYGEVDSTEQKMGKLTLSAVTTQQIGGPSSSHAIKLEYAIVGSFTPPGGSETPTLALKKKIIEPLAGPPIELHTAYDHDGFGNVVVTTDCASDFPACDQAGAINPEDPTSPAHPAFRTVKVSSIRTTSTPPRRRRRPSIV